MTRWRLVDWWGYVTLPDGSAADTGTLQNHVAQRGLTNVHRLGGNFSFVAQDVDSAVLALVTDACGTVPLNWTARPAFAHPDLALVRERVAASLINRPFIAASLARSYGLRGQTPFLGISAVPAGSIVFLRPDGHYRTEQYLDLARLRPLRISPPRAVELMQQTLHAAVRDAVRGQAVATHLSGGLDSGVVAAIAADHTQLVGAYSWVAPSAGPEFAPVRQSAQALGLDPVVAAYGAPEGAWLQSADPLVYPAWGLLLYEATTLPLASQSGATTLLSGWGGDHFASAGVSAPDLFLLSGNWREWMRHSHAVALSTGVSTLRAMSLHRIGQPRRGRRLPQRPSQLLAVRQDRLRWRTSAWWQAGARFGITYRYPLLDPRVVRLACQLPVGYFAREGVGRWGFRQIAAQLLPPDVAFRPTKAELGRVAQLRMSSYAADETRRAIRAYPELAADFALWRRSREA